MPDRLSYMHDFMEKFKEMVLFNTIVNHENPDGLTYYDLTQINPNIPHSRIYRAMKKLEETGFLKMKEVNSELGRPKHYYTLTQKGKERQEELKQNFGQMFAAIQQRLSEDLSTIDFRHLPKRDFHEITNSIVMSEDSLEEKLEKLAEIEEEHKKCLKIISDAKEEIIKKEQSN
jgi:DNA-binding PadR family transcriptional regulator